MPVLRMIGTQCLELQNMKQADGISKLTSQLHTGALNQRLHIVFEQQGSQERKMNDIGQLKGSVIANESKCNLLESMTAETLEGNNL